MKRPLFVFAGQSNMMGAAVYEASEQFFYTNSFEYLHKPKRLGKKIGEFKNYAFPTGEFSYIDLQRAYGEAFNCNNKSSLNNYSENTYFCPAMNNFKSEEGKNIFPFEYFSEASLTLAPSLAPYIIKLLEENDIYCAYTHIAKGGVSIQHFIDGAAAKYFDEKVLDFFNDSNIRFEQEDTNEKILVWLQGEADSQMGYHKYFNCLDELWKKCKKIGFTKFFIIRVGYWGDDRILEIMKAQEDFCKNNDDVYILTRVCSYLKFYGSDLHIYNCNIPNEFMECRDSFYGFNNQHINEKGFKTIAKYAVPNIIRVLLHNENPILEKEKIKFE